MPGQHDQPAAVGSFENVLLGVALSDDSLEGEGRLAELLYDLVDVIPDRDTEALGGGHDWLGLRRCRRLHYRGRGGVRGRLL